jgi:hypothetical protein
MASEQIVHRSVPGGIRHSPAEPYSMELAKWETRPLPDGSVTQEMIDDARREGVHHGAFEYREFPKMLYKATQTPNGIKLTDQQIVDSLVQQRNLESRGFRASQEEALQVVEDANQAAAVGAAERAFSDRKMSAKAQAEAEALDHSTSRHLGEIPEAPIKKRRPYTRRMPTPAVE